MAGKVGNDKSGGGVSGAKTIDDLIAKMPKEMDEQEMIKFKRQMETIKNAYNMMMEALDSKAQLCRRSLEG